MKTQNVWRKVKKVLSTGLLLCTVGEYGVPAVVGTFLSVGATYKAAGYILEATDSAGGALNESVPGADTAP